VCVVASETTLTVFVGTRTANNVEGSHPTKSKACIAFQATNDGALGAMLWTIVTRRPHIMVILFLFAAGRSSAFRAILAISCNASLTKHFSRINAFLFCYVPEKLL